MRWSMTGRRPLAQVVQRTSVGLLFGFAIVWLSNELSNWVIKKNTERPEMKNLQS